MENAESTLSISDWYSDIFKSIFIDSGAVKRLTSCFDGLFDKYADKHIKIDPLIKNLSEEDKFKVKNRIFNYIIRNKKSIDDLVLEYTYGDVSNAYVLKDNICGDYYVFYIDNNVPYVASFDANDKEKAIRFASQNYFITQG